MSQIPEINFIIDCHEPHAEVMELETKTVWQSRLPLSRERLDNLALPPGFIGVGAGTAVMDAHYFRRSPGQVEDGAVAERDISGHQFIHCANPPAGGAETPVPDGPKLLIVDKHHSLIFMPGRDVDLLSLPDGSEYIQVITASPKGGGLLQSDKESGLAYNLALPAEWKLRTVTVTSRITNHLPNPTKAWFFANGANFQGPVTDELTK